MIEADAGHPLTELDFRRSRLLKNEDISPSDGGLSLYTSSYFEGDIIGPKPVSVFNCIHSSRKKDRAERKKRQESIGQRVLIVKKRRRRKRKKRNSFTC